MMIMSVVLSIVTSSAHLFAATSSGGLLSKILAQKSVSRTPPWSAVPWTSVAATRAQLAGNS